MIGIKNINNNPAKTKGPKTFLTEFNTHYMYIQNNQIKQHG